MNVKRIFSLLLIIFGEAFIIICFLLFWQNIQIEILVLNIIVSSLIYCLLFIDIIIPWVDFKDKSQKTIGSIGLRWIITFFYMLLAIGTMIFLNTENTTDFIYQLIFHGVLFFLLLLGLFFSFSSAEKVKEAYEEEKQTRDHINDMKKVIKELQLKIDSMKNIPSDVTSRINGLQENLRFLSPCNNNDAFNLEKKFVEEMRALCDYFYNIPVNFEEIDNIIKSCEKTYKERKNIFSN
jgi:hypothetical protein